MLIFIIQYVTGKRYLSFEACNLTPVHRASNNSAWAAERTLCDGLKKDATQGATGTERKRPIF